jgi:transcriptional regulator with XRE-family HTH domain
MSEKKEFSERLAQSIQNAGFPLRPSILEREFNMRYWGKPVTIQAVRRWIRGEAIPSQEKIHVLAKWLNVEPHVLRFGNEASSAKHQESLGLDVILSIEERKVIQRYLDLPANKRKIIGEVINHFSIACEQASQ